MLKSIKKMFSKTSDESESSPSSEEKQTSNSFDLEAFKMSEDIKVFALSTCIHCRNAKKYLDECGVKYNCVHVDELTGEDRKQVVQEIKKHNPSVSFPTIVFKDTVVVGYHKDKIDEALKG